MRDVWKYKAYNLRTGELCPHAHHSKESAQRCAQLESWTRYKVRRVSSHSPTSYKKPAPKGLWKAEYVRKVLTKDKEVQE